MPKQRKQFDKPFLPGETENTAQADDARRYKAVVRYAKKYNLPMPIDPAAEMKMVGDALKEEMDRVRTELDQMTVSFDAETNDLQLLMKDRWDRAKGPDRSRIVMLDTEGNRLGNARHFFKDLLEVTSAARLITPEQIHESRLQDFDKLMENHHRLMNHFK